MKYLVILNVLVPGSGLLLRDRVLLGCGLLIATICLVAVVIAAPLVMSLAFTKQVLLYAALAYGVLFAVAGLLWWRLEAATPLSDAVLREKHATITKAWLSGMADEARLEARSLVRRARHLPEVWALYALVHEGKDAQRAQERALYLRRRGQ